MTSLRTPTGADLSTPTLTVLPPVAPLLTCPTCEHRPTPPVADGRPVCSALDEDESDATHAVDCLCDDPWHHTNRRRPAPTHRFSLRSLRRARPARRGA